MSLISLDSNTLAIRLGNNRLITVPVFLLLALAALLLPLLTNAFLPWIGVHFFSDKISGDTLPKLAILLLGGLGYFLFVKTMVSRPIYLVVYCAILMRLVFSTNAFLEPTGIHVPTRILHMIFLNIPAFILIGLNFKFLCRYYGYFKYLFLFIFILGLYVLFFNLGFVDPAVATGTNVTIAEGTFNDYVYCIISIAITASAFRQTKTPEGAFTLFRNLNLALAIFALTHALVSLFGYPFDICVKVVEGFRRSTGIFEHPNQFAKYEGLILLYFTGLLYHYNQLKNSRLIRDQVLLGATIIVNIPAFILTISKNSLAIFCLCFTAFLIMALLDPKIRLKILLPLGVCAGLIMLAVLGYQALIGNDISELLTGRINDTRSLQWRYIIWTFLLDNIRPENLLFGHGLTSSNIEVYRLVYNVSLDGEQSVYVHNAFINFLYDMGLLGLLIFSGFVHNILMSAKNLLRTRNPLFLTIACLSVFAMASSLVDECISDPNVNILLWLMVTMIYSYLRLVRPHELR
jgi:hypothetical protein